MTVVVAMVDGLRVDAAGGGHHRAGQRNAQQGDDQFLVHNAPFLSVARPPKLHAAEVAYIKCGTFGWKS